MKVTLNAKCAKLKGDNNIYDVELLKVFIPREDDEFALYEVRIKGCTITYPHTDITFYASETDAIAGNEANKSEYKFGDLPNNINDCNSRTWYKADTENDTIIKYELDKVADCLVRDNIANAWYYVSNNEMVEKFTGTFSTYEECAKWYGIPRIDINGNKYMKKGELSKLLLTPEQEEVIVQIEELLKKAKDMHINFVVSTEDESMTPYNAEHVYDDGNTAWDSELDHTIDELPYNLFPHNIWCKGHEIWQNEGCLTFKFKNED